MDVIAAHQFGYRNVVASMGTAVTESQLGLLKRHTTRVVLAWMPTRPAKWQWCARSTRSPIPAARMFPCRCRASD